jgi:ubiquinone/menaquinone biosynthesis C-methylase UbiE
MAHQLDSGGAEPRAILAAADFSGARVFEIGSGNGRLTFRFAAAAQVVIGVDLKHAELASALQDCPDRFRSAVRFACASAISLPFRDAGFDIALFASAL